MSDLFGGEERFSKFLADVEASTSIKVTGGDDTSSAEPAMPEEAPVEVLEDNAANDEKLGQDMQDTTEDISSDAEGIEHFASMYDNFSAFGQHVKKYDLSKDVYAFMNVSTGYITAVTANGFTVPSVDKYTNTATNKAAIMEANDGMLARMRTAIVNFFKSLWENIKKFGGFLKGYLDKALGAFAGLKQTILKMLPKNTRVNIRVAEYRKKYASIVRNMDDASILKLLDLADRCEQIVAEGGPEAYASEFSELLSELSSVQGTENAETSRPNDDEVDISADEALKLIEASEQKLKIKDRLMQSLNKVNVFIQKTIAKLSSAKEGSEEAKSLPAYKKLAGGISKMVAFFHGYFTKMVSFATNVCNKAIDAARKLASKSGDQTTPAV